MIVKVTLAYRVTLLSLIVKYLTRDNTEQLGRPLGSHSESLEIDSTVPELFPEWNIVRNCNRVVR